MNLYRKNNHPNRNKNRALGVAETERLYGRVPPGIVSPTIIRAVREEFDLSPSDAGALIDYDGHAWTQAEIGKEPLHIQRWERFCLVAGVDSLTANFRHYRELTEGQRRQVAARFIETPPHDRFWYVIDCDGSITDRAPLSLSFRRREPQHHA
jgi:hypothetical protein